MGAGVSEGGSKKCHFLRIQTDRKSPLRSAGWIVPTRILCHFVMSRLPDSALPDLCGALADMYAYYGATTHLSAIPSEERHAATFGKEVDRSPFSLDGD